MNHTRLWIAAAIIAIVIVAGFVLSVPHTREVAQTPAPQPVAAVPSVTLHDVFKKGIHTITGSLEAPDACTIVTATTSLEGDASSTQDILLAVSMPPDTGVCLQLPTRMDFSTTAAAPALTPITVTVNGVVASTTSS
ncbi:MAG: hypothetical protein KGI71_02295 [Patescibacteria group bacterium]|nr:hypothetical protein [Patescibacteria group bacterium]